MSLPELKAAVKAKHRYIAEAARHYKRSRFHLSRVLNGAEKLADELRELIEADLAKPKASEMRVG